MLIIGSGHCHILGLLFIHDDDCKGIEEKERRDKDPAAAHADSCLFCQEPAAPRWQFVSPLMLIMHLQLINRGFLDSVAYVKSMPRLLPTYNSIPICSCYYIILVSYRTLHALIPPERLLLL